MSFTYLLDNRLLFRQLCSSELPRFNGIVTESIGIPENHLDVSTSLWYRTVQPDNFQCGRSVSRSERSQTVFVGAQGGCNSHGIVVYVEYWRISVVLCFHLCFEGTCVLAAAINRNDRRIWRTAGVRIFLRMLWLCILYYNVFQGIVEGPWGARFTCGTTDLLRCGCHRKFQGVETWLSFAIVVGGASSPIRNAGKQAVILISNLQTTFLGCFDPSKTVQHHENK